MVANKSKHNGPAGPHPLWDQAADPECPLSRQVSEAMRTRSTEPDATCQGTLTTLACAAPGLAPAQTRLAPLGPSASSGRGNPRVRISAPHAIWPACNFAIFLQGGTVW